MAETSQGKCQYCKRIFSKQGMKKHLDICEKRSDNFLKVPGDNAESYFCITVEGQHAPEYWLYLDVSAERTTLKDLDKFLRDMWLECCGHLSQFVLNNEYYTVSSERDYEEHSMNYKLGYVLEVGTRFRHEYDFGSTTELKLKVVSNRTGIRRKKKIELMARNIMPDVKCAVCGSKATLLCTECMWDNEEEAALCDNCAAEHECGEELLLPVCNSPRSGVCGYEGGMYDED